MKKLVNFFLLILIALYSASSLAQSINLGRGAIPVHLPFDYDENIPTPVVIVLHGTGSTGMRQDNYLGISKVVNQVGTPAT